METPASSSQPCSERWRAGYSALGGVAPGPRLLPGSAADSVACGAPLIGAHQQHGSISLVSDASFEQTISAARIDNDPS